MRVGFGFDVHQFSSNREFWLGGVKIPADIGISGHSDADVLLHAIADAVLGALALGDIGQHFPPSDQSIKNIDSKIILKHCIDLIHNKGYKVGNIDCTVVSEKPKIMPYAIKIREQIATICLVSKDDISVKATTNEKMGFIGREEGIAAYAIVALVKQP